MDQICTIPASPPTSPPPQKAAPAEGKGNKAFKALIAAAVRKSASRPEAADESADQTADIAQNALALLGLVPVIPDSGLSEETLADLPGGAQPVDIIPTAQVIPSAENLAIHAEALISEAAIPEMPMISISRPDTIKQAAKGNADPDAADSLSDVKAEPLRSSIDGIGQASKTDEQISAHREPIGQKKTAINQIADPLHNAQPHEAVRTGPAPAANPNSEAPLPMAAYAEDFPVKMSQIIIAGKADGQREFEIELYPRELGKVTVSVLFDSGKAIISLACESAKAQTLLNAHAENIRSIIESTTGYNTTANVGKSEQTPQQFDSDGHNRENHHQRQPERRGHEETSDFIHKLRLGLTAAS